ncbi:U1 small nuclear ribonucleoprotein, putative [Entamoeba histolytica HM-1:IMSS-B]|uniref:Matrin-type domain-containing protein n=8 Tax=Entamoeba TaxID=5758 RepID=C4LSB7_ENTH1|nr:U1 zinc finger protein [Entamoeba nuttalli P19]XP_656390.1 hypothetical protein EHI_153250 [Entamoeba histolytica HM-1:IMSS]EMD45279.1 putative U1 zinc finger protein [Entamoeba histolytica KU27]EMH74409.1 U1 small nuclear ribonucleoprotein, putative [Entamoeba histolytica HM-1:IMSS-B]EMS17376.1 U1 zinc finger protein [Entamoeba histolytica HM-3:IMSS]ENY63979.1 U1 zinc finger protein, putative [Entamoeba histolytica HM-1:IMSS-A]GAT91579.1 hypothetical protein CL6EHI_153250 [Entamoeba histo|eukprot:XP_008859137.1 U1 zinc finger protein [Entamoeba nuttalli P19]
MGKKRYYCEYCQKHLVYGGTRSRKEHILGKKHKDKMVEYFKQFEANILQRMIDMVVLDYQTNGPNTTTQIPQYTPYLSTWEKQSKLQYQQIAESMN